MTESQPDVTVALQKSLHERFERLIKQVEPDAVLRYGIGWALMTHDVDNAIANRKDLKALLGDNSLEVMRVNHACHVSFMRSIFDLRSVPCFVGVVAWVYRSYIARGFSPRYFPIELRAWQQAIDKYVTPRTETHGLLAFYQGMIDSHDDFVTLAQQPEPEIEFDPEFEPIGREFLDALLSPSEHEAQTVLIDRMHGATALPVWWEQVVAPALRTIGQLWSQGKITVAQEHMATLIAQRVMSRGFPTLPQPAHDGALIAVVVSPGEQHEVGASMVCDVLRLCGCRVLFTGANTPAESILALALHNNLDALLISTTMPYHLDRVKHLIAQIRRHTAGRTPLLVVGGQAYAFDPDLVERVGADQRLEHLADLAQLAKRQAAS